MFDYLVAQTPILFYNFVMDDKDIVAANLAKYRKQAGYSQLELAEKLHYSNKNISKWENGETTPNVFVLKQIAQLYGVKVDDFVSTSQVDPKQVTALQNKIDRRKKLIFRLGMLLLANAIVYGVATVLIFGLQYGDIGDFNKYLIYLYFAPLSFLSVTIYIRVIYKFVEIISLSAFGWSICLGIYLSLMNAPNITFIFVLGIAYELIVLFIALLLNVKLFDKSSQWIKKLFSKRKKQTQLD